MDETFYLDCEIICSEFWKVYTKNLIKNFDFHDGELFRLKGDYKNKPFKMEDCHNFKEIMSIVTSLNRIRRPVVMCQLNKYNIPWIPFYKPYYYIHIYRVV